MSYCFLVTAMAFLSAQGAAAKGDALDSLPTDFGAAERFLNTELADDALWLDAKRRPTLEKYLAAAKTVRSAKLAPILAKNIAYSIRPRHGDPLEEQLPAYGALRSIGIDAVKPILGELKNIDAVDPEINSVEDERKKIDNMIKLGHRASKKANQKLLVLCLIEIYDRGGFGKSLVRHRIEFEAAGAKGKEKERLLKVLEDPFLK